MNFELAKKYQRKQGGSGFLYAHWHQDILAAVAAHLNSRVCTMASLSLDGDIISYFLTHLGFKVARGSPGKGGRKALEEMEEIVQQSHDGALAVDGSRGPQFKVKKGIVYLARSTGKPIFCLALASRKKKDFGSWDRMYCPLPFSKVVAVYSEPIFIPSLANEKLMEEKRQEVEKVLLNLKKQANEYFQN